MYKEKEKEKDLLYKRINEIETILKTIDNNASYTEIITTFCVIFTIVIYIIIYL
jgi:hypothetical protein